MTSKSNPRTLITGASSGIGAELARECARHGQSLILVSRRAEKLGSLGNELKQRHRVAVDVVELDLESARAAEQLATRVAQMPVTVENLVNNAGFGANGFFSDLSLEVQVSMLQLNCAVLTELCHRLLPMMLAQRRGRILNVASTAAFQPGPFMAVYYASKAYVLSLSEALAEELRGTGVSVTALCPGATRTEFQSRANASNMRLMRLGVASARSVAAHGFKAMMAGKAIAIPGLQNKLLRQSARLTPHALVRRIVRVINNGSPAAPRKGEG